MTTKAVFPVQNLAEFHLQKQTFTKSNAMRVRIPKVPIKTAPKKPIKLKYH